MLRLNTVASAHNSMGLIDAVAVSTGAVGLGFTSNGPVTFRGTGFSIFVALGAVNEGAFPGRRIGLARGGVVTAGSGGSAKTNVGISVGIGSGGTAAVIESVVSGRTAGADVYSEVEVGVLDEAIRTGAGTMGFLVCIQAATPSDIDTTIPNSNSHNIHTWDLLFTV